jgi:peptidoglycan/LPS O-acetylase OafA/YrhL
VLPGLLLTAVCAFATLHFFAASDVATGNLAYHGLAPAGLEARLGILPALGNALFLQEVLVPTFASNGPLWSLAYEFWYYAMFPLLLLAVAAPRWRWRLLYVVLLVGCAALVGWDILLYFPVWLLGAATAFLQPRLLVWTGRLRAGTRAVLRVCAVTATCVAMIASSAGILGGFGDAAVALAATALLGLLLRDDRMSGLFGTAVEAVGRYADASFSLYVVHLPLLALFAAAVLPRAADRYVPGAMAYVVYAGLVLSALIAGWFFASVTEFHTWKVRRWAAARLGGEGRGGVTPRALRAQGPPQRG